MTVSNESLALILKSLDQIASGQVALIEQGRAIMSGLTDLNSALTTLTNGVSAAAAEIASLSSQLSAAVAAGTGDNDAAIEAIAQKFNAQSAALAQAVAAANPSPAPASGGSTAPAATAAATETPAA